jgi:hydroxyacylglutathione hydrolase
MIKQIKDNVWQLYFKEFGSCVYLLKLPEPVLIDTSSKEAEDELKRNLKELNILPEDIGSIILTHNHWDHIGNINLFHNAKIYSMTNLNELKKDFKDLKIIKTPGHTREDICILYNDILFSGDTIFNNGYIGRTDLPESNEKQMQESLKLLKKTKYKILCPGHII